MKIRSVRSLSFLAVLLAASVLPGALRAQTAMVESRVPVSTLTIPAATVDAPGPRLLASDGVRWGRALPTFDLPPRDHVNAGPNVAMMAVGGAGLVIGSIIGGSGGTIIAVGGAAVGLVGLWRYLR